VWGLALCGHLLRQGAGCGARVFAANVADCQLAVWPALLLMTKLGARGLWAGPWWRSERAVG